MSTGKKETFLGIPKEAIGTVLKGLGIFAVAVLGLKLLGAVSIKTPPPLANP